MKPQHCSGAAQKDLDARRGDDFEHRRTRSTSKRKINAATQQMSLFRQHVRIKKSRA
jgi:uncharacterized caspase-like protein